MTRAEFFDLVGTITYKPDIFIKFDLDLMMGPGIARVSLSRRAEDATHPDRPIIEICSMGAIDFGRADREAVLRHVFSFVSEFEMHELKEWFKVDGRCFENPHPDRSS